MTCWMSGVLERARDRRARGFANTRSAVPISVPAVALTALLAICTQTLAQVAVTDGGTPSYGIAIKAPPGISGMTPGLGLQYTGSRINGPVGYGWAIQGLSTITRCPSTVVQDGAIKGVAFGPADRLCLDGQRLIQTSAAGQSTAPSAATNGTLNDAMGPVIGAPTEYRTEKDSYARIRAYGSAGGVAANGPAYFKVWTKSGQIYEYGAGPSADANTNALVAAQGQSAAMVWAVSRISDTLGSYIDFKYIQRDTAWGSSPSLASPSLGREWNLVEVQYTGNGGQAPTNKIVFSYSDRPVSASGSPQDRAEAYQQGSKNISISRLDAVRTYVNWSGLALGVTPQGTSYPNAAVSPTSAGMPVTPPASAVKVGVIKIAYSLGPNTGRSRVASVTECVGASETQCLPPTTFQYTPGGDQTFIPNANFAASALSKTVQMLDPTNNAYGAVTGDFNSDGKTDILRWGTAPANNQIWFNAGNGTFNQLSPNTGVGPSYVNNLQLFSSDGCYVSYVADFNGDGIADILRTVQTTNNMGGACAADTNQLYLGNGDGSFKAPAPLTGIDLSVVKETFRSVVIADCSIASIPLRDGDLLAMADIKVAITVNSCPGQSKTIGKAFYLLDVNGDGMLDIVTTINPAYPATPYGNITSADERCASSAVCTKVYLGSASGAFTPLAGTNLTNHSVYADPPDAGAKGAFFKPNTVDVNGDGLADLSVKTGTWLSDGKGNFTLAPSSTQGACANSIDFNGDGRPDCLYPTSVPITAGSVSQYINVMTGGAFANVGGFNLTGVGQDLWGQNTTTLQQNIGTLIGDFVGDGRNGILRWQDSPSGNVLYLSNGDGTFRQSTSFNLTGPNQALRTSDGTTSFLLGDFTGNGALEILRMKSMLTAGSEGTTNQLYARADESTPDLLQSVTTPAGLKTTLTYVPLTNSSLGSIGNRYTAGTVVAYPKVNVAAPVYVVATMTSDTGISGTGPISTEYSYQGLRAHILGRGLLGFARKSQQGYGPNGSPLSVSTDYLQDWPYIGATSVSQTFNGGIGSTTRLSRTTNAYCDVTSGTIVAAIATGGQPPVACATTALVQRPYLAQTYQEGWDLGTGAPLPTTSTTNTFGPSGDPAQIVVSTTGTALGLSQTVTKTTTNTYDADVTSQDSWVLGRLLRASQRNVVPNSLPSIATSAGTAPNATATRGTSQTQFASLSTIAFGSVTTTFNAVQTSTLTNTGALPLTITVPTSGSVAGTGFAFASTTCTASLPAYGSCTVSVSFTPTAATAYAGTLTVVTGAGTQTATLSGTGIAPSVVFVPVSTNWGVVGVASDSGDWPTIKNNTASSVLLAAHSTVSGPSGMWSWQGAAGACIPGTTVLAPGGSCQTFFGIGGAGTPGSYTATDQISYQVVGGNGVTFTTQQSYSFSLASTTPTPSSLAFGNVNVSTTSAAQTFTLKNNAVNGGSVKNLAISVVGNQPANFPISHNCGTSLAAGASCTVTVSFNPTWIANGFSASVQIQGGYSRIQGGADTGYTPLTGVSFTVPLSGNGYGSIATITSGLLNFGTVAQYTAAPANTLTIRNDGTAPMSLSSAWSGLPAALAVTSNSCSAIAPSSACVMTIQMTTASAVSFNQAVATVGATTNAAATATGTVTAAPALSVVVTGADIANGGYSNSVRAAPSGGVAPYTYLWTKLSGTMTVSGSTTASTVTLVGKGYCQEVSAIMQVVVTDSAGHQVTGTGEAYMVLGPPPGKPYCVNITSPAPGAQSMNEAEVGAQKESRS